MISAVGFVYTAFRISEYESQNNNILETEHESLYGVFMF